MPLTWVVGASGLIGQAVWRAAVERGHEVRRFQIPWESGPLEQVAALRTGLSAMLEEASGERWHLIWVAGAGVVGTAPETLDRETQVFSRFLDDVTAISQQGIGPEAMFVASSAGGVYAGSRGAPFTEESQIAPLAPYGHQKLALESRAREFAAQTSTPLFIGRITNAYGPGQNLAKAQGLVSQLAKAQLLHRPISLYVSLDTIRDYIFVDDCARMILSGVAGAAAARPAEPVVKILGSGVPVTIATLLGEYHRLFRRRLPVVLGDSPNRRFQVRDLRMHSTRWRHLDRLGNTPLPAGIAATVGDLSARLRLGEMASAAR